MRNWHLRGTMVRGMLLMKIKREIVADSYSPVLPLVAVLCPTCSASSCAGCSKLPKDNKYGFLLREKVLKWNFSGAFLSR